MLKNFLNKKIFLSLIIFIFLFCFIGTNYCSADLLNDLNTNMRDSKTGTTYKTFSQGNYIKTNDEWVEMSSLKGRMESMKNWAADAYAWTDKWLKEGAAAVAWKTALSTFLNRLAYDTATYLATGDKGQAPMFRTESVGDFLTNAADYAAGDFLETLSDGTIGQKFNICKLDPQLKIKLGLGLYKDYRPDEPDCTFSEMKENWEETLQDPNFLNRFQAVFDPKQNDLGRALTIQSGFNETIDKNIDEAFTEMLVNQGWKDKTSKISKAIQTPSSLVFENAGNVMEKLTAGEEVYTGDFAADAFNIFTNTLVGKLAEKWFKKGLVLKFPDNSYDGDWGGFADYDAGPYKEGIKGAEERFLGFTDANFNERGDYEILGELTACPDPQKAGPTNCVINEKFRQAIAEKLTVGEAMKKGYLDSDGIFGFNADGLEPSYNEAYPYRSMIILRKFRIIPVGWELAAQFIKDNQHQVNGTKNLGDLVACFDIDDDYSGYYEHWCQGLVDPTWVLKAPLNYCKKEGNGPEITTERIFGQGDDSEIMIGRNDNYCADEQACIKEDDNGACQLYGYCTEEKRKWLFNAESCDPMFNTCQTFKSQKDKQTVSYLENTLNYAGCSADNAGCSDYCQDYDYAAGEYTCADNDNDGNIDGNIIYLDRDAEECDSASEGCHEFIRVEKGLGTNLYPNSSFEEPVDDNDPIFNLRKASPDESAAAGRYYLELLAGDFELEVPLSLKDPYVSMEGLPLTFSAYLKDCGDNVVLSVGGKVNATIDSSTKEVSNSASWLRYQVSHQFSEFFTPERIFFSISGHNEGCMLDAVKVEFSEKATVYADYRANNLIYEKIIPNYLESACYVNAAAGDYKLGAQAPAACLNYARRCNANEAGCKLYTSQKDQMTIAGKVIGTDYCPSECVGYNQYLQLESTFDTSRPFNFIPASAQKCSAGAVGCDEFTNLDKLGQNAEAREYYSELRQCIKPDDTCREFYVWEGSEQSGYQLKVFTLKADSAAYEPALTRSDTTECTPAIYYLPATDPAYNPDCREFYNTNGEISYHLLSRTISCSENCHPYRRTENNLLPKETAISDCKAECNGSPTCEMACINPLSCENGNNIKICAYNNEAVFCKNNGLWNSQHGRCLYSAIPDEGQKCSASAAGCREYSGSSGSNVRFVVNDDIETGTVGVWLGDLPADENPSNVSLTVNGHSLYASGADNAIYQVLGNNLEENKSYYITFLAKAEITDTTFAEIGLISGAPAKAVFEGAENAELSSSEWRQYSFNLPVLDHAVDNEEKLYIKANNAFYIDNIRLVEIVDRYYLVKNSWEQDVCLYDTFGAARDEYYNLGCEAYTDKDRKTHNLRKFTDLCADSAVGCELMIDTHNYSQFTGGELGGVSPQVNIPDDNFAYAVYNPDKACNAKDKGCERLGDPYKYDEQVIYGDIFLKNDPDKYETILCGSDAVQCEAWANSGGGMSYFKDPGDMACEYRLRNASPNPLWFEKQVKKCDSEEKADGTKDGVINKDTETVVCRDSGDCEVSWDCTTDSQCPYGECFEGKCHDKCILDTNDIECPVSFKTIGTGGYGAGIDQPFDGWAGFCPAGQAGCSEYIDPLSRFSSNIIFNPSFADLDGDKNSGDGWINGAQDVKLEPETLYVFRKSDKDGVLAGNLHIVCNGDIAFRLLSEDNNFGDYKSQIGNDNGANYLLFTREQNEIISCTVMGGQAEYTIELKEAAVSYQLKQKVDKTACNGLVDYEKGCVLFNERSIASKENNNDDYNNLLWDADLTFNDGNGVSPQSSEVTNGVYNNDSQVLLKVTPDRDCKTWLACRTYVKDENNNNVCYDVGLCNRFDANGNCGYFINFEKNNSSVGDNFTKENVLNYAGYTKVGNIFNSFNADMIPFGEMEQIGGNAEVPNGGFELYGSNKYPLGWHLTSNTEWLRNNFSAISNPYQAQEEGIKYPMIGKSYLKLSPSAAVIESDFIDVEPGGKYAISAFINTKNFHQGPDVAMSAAHIAILTYDKDGKRTFFNNSNRGVDIIECENQPQPWLNGCDLGAGEGIDWSNYSRTFKVGPNTRKITVYIYGVAYADLSSVCTGNRTTEGYPCYCEMGSNSTYNPTEDGDYIFNVGGMCNDWDDHDFSVPIECRNWIGAPPIEFKIDENTCAGNAYFDEIKITPALSTRTGTYLTNKVPQTCRLYPQDDSLACDYLDDSGIKQNGIKGYCLEYDRYPGNKDACLLWYPIDKVQGEGIEEGAGYVGKYPVYYCTDSNYSLNFNYQGTSDDTMYFAVNGKMKISNIRFPSGTLDQNYLNVGKNAIAVYAYDNKCCHFQVGLEIKNNLMGFNMKNDGWQCREAPAASDTYTTADIESELINMSINGYEMDFKWGNPGSPSSAYLPGGKYYNTSVANSVWANDVARGAIYCRYEFDIMPRCTQIVQTVTPVGLNKFWSGRVYEGSKYSFLCNDGLAGLNKECKYDTDSIPFGSAVVPGNTWNMVANPYEWTEPLYYKLPESNEPRMGQLHTEDDLKNIFAQSYGIWNWDDAEKHYVQANGGGWSPPQGQCVENKRDASSPYCGVAPVINNIRVNNDTTGYDMTGGGFVNLTFNVKVDSQQLPLVLYSIDWGDGKFSTISGVEMRDRTNSSNPFSLYHYYNYWDLKRALPVCPGENCCGIDIVNGKNYCQVRPGVKVKDNWGWCNGGINCIDFDTGAWIKVYEK